MADLNTLGTSVANSLKARVAAVIDGELDKEAITELLAAIQALQTVTRGLVDAERHLHEEERRKDAARASLAGASASDANRLKERIAASDARIEQLSGLRSDLAQNLDTLAQSLR